MSCQGMEDVLKTMERPFAFESASSPKNTHQGAAACQVSFVLEANGPGCDVM